MKAIGCTPTLFCDELDLSRAREKQTCFQDILGGAIGFTLPNEIISKLVIVTFSIVAVVGCPAEINGKYSILGG